MTPRQPSIFSSFESRINLRFCSFFEPIFLKLFRSIIAPILALSCIVLLSQHAVASASDTLIIGGKKVVVERVVTYDTIPVIEDPELELEKPKLKKNHVLFFQTEGGMNRGQLLHEASDLVAVNEFIGNSTRNGVYFKLELGYEKPLNDQLRLKGGIGIHGCKVVNYTFDLELLDDSLFRFESFKPNELSQITRLRYDIGTETDTIPLPLNTETIEQFYLTFPLELVWAQARNQNRTNWQRRNTAGLGLTIMYALNQPQSTLTAVSIFDASFTQASPEDYLFKPWVLAPKIFVGQRWISKQKNAIWVKVNASFPFRTIDPLETKFYFNQQWLGLSAGVNIFLP